MEMLRRTPINVAQHGRSTRSDFLAGAEILIFQNKKPVTLLEDDSIALRSDTKYFQVSGGSLPHREVEPNPSGGQRQYAITVHPGRLTVLCIFERAKSRYILHTTQLGAG